MIIYGDSAFGLNLIWRVHGSAVYRSILPALLSVVCLIFFRKFWRGEDVGNLYFEEEGDGSGDPRAEKEIQHPYAVGVLVVSTTFLLVFRANNGYARYWEACSAVHHMMSKWMDSTMQIAVYHLQCDHYDSIKPPSYYDYPELNSMFLTRARERERTTTTTENNGSAGTGNPRRGRSHDPHIVDNRQERANRAFDKSINCVPYTDHETTQRHSFRGRQRQLWTKSTSSRSVDKDHPLRRRKPRPLFSPNDGDDVDGNIPQPLEGPARLDGSWGGLFKDGKATFYNPKEHGDDFLFENTRQLPSFASHHGGRTPPLFLQELSHLSSLMVAVALSTLRNDIDEATSPLGVYTPGAKWPEVDADKIHDFKLSGSWIQGVWSRFLYLIGGGTSLEERTRYNAARPLPVLGGVSDNEILFLQMAQGPYAKTQLTWNWLCEYVIREHLSGSLGNVGPPIISRFIQFMSDGMIYYNHARKIMFVPFPFPHAQLSALFIFITIPAIAFLMEQYADDLIIGGLLTFFSVLCLSGVHEVARELENPFRNVPNELPLVTFQAQYNEALIIMFSGYHPDQFWVPPRPVSSSSENSPVGSASTANKKNTNNNDNKPSPSQSPSKPREEEKQATSKAGTQDPQSSSPATTANASTNASNERLAAADREQILYLQRKIEDFGREIERLRMKGGI